MAGVALVAAVDVVLCLNGSFGHRRGTAPGPKLRAFAQSLSTAGLGMDVKDATI
jgi:hypothetical protein